MQLLRRERPNAELITLIEAKRYLRIINNEHDDDIMDAVRAATDMLDLDDDGFGSLDFPLVSQVWAVQLGAARSSLTFPFQKVTAINHVSYWDGAGVEQTLDVQSYHLVKKENREWRFQLASGVAVPVAASRPDAFEIEFVAGYESTDAVPNDLKQAARFLMAHYYENREAVIVGTIGQELPFGVEAILRKYRRMVF